MNLLPVDLRTLKLCEPARTRSLLRFAIFGALFSLGWPFLALTTTSGPEAFILASAGPLTYLAALIYQLWSLERSVDQELARLALISAGRPQADPDQAVQTAKDYEPTLTETLARRVELLTSRVGQDIRAHPRVVLLGSSTLVGLVLFAFVALQPSRAPGRPEPAASLPPATEAPQATGVVASAVPAEAPVPSPNPPQAVVATPAPVPTETPLLGIYVVKAGDTLVSLAARWGVSVDAIVELNGIANPSLILTGVALRVPPGARQ